MVTFKRTDKDGEEVTIPFDLLHVVPPQTAPQFIRESSIAAETGFVDVDQFTLRSNKYPNVFALGDVANLPTAKTAAAVYSQSPVVAHNIVQVDQQKGTNATYAGYSSCPLFVGDKKLMLMEFKYDNTPDETFKSNQEVPTWFFFLFKKYLFPWVYFSVAPKGLWYGRGGFFKPKFE